MSSSRLVRRHGVVSFFLSFIVSPSSTTIKNSIVLCSFKKLTTTFFFFSSFIQVLDFDGSNDAFRCVLFFVFVFF